MPPGRLRLRMSIQDAAAQVLDQDVREMSIRDLRGDVAVGTPEVLRARNAREFRTLDAAGGGAGGVARVQPDRAPADPLPARTAPPARRPSVSAKLLGRDGHAMRELDGRAARPTPRRQRDRSAARRLRRRATTSIEVNATSGAREATERTAFRVTY